jgi:hypothetical protein
VKGDKDKTFQNKQNIENPPGGSKELPGDFSIIRSNESKGTVLFDSFAIRRNRSEKLGKLTFCSGLRKNLAGVTVKMI